MMINGRFLLRESLHGWRHAILFVLCVSLSLMTLTALNGFKAGVNRSLFHDARQLHGGDIILHSHYPLSSPLMAAVEGLRQQGTVETTMIHEFYSVVRSPGREGTLLSEIKAVDDAFPLYGRVELGSGQHLQEVLAPGSAVVAPDVLTRLGLEVGDRLQVGSASLRIADTVVYESDSPVNILNFGPRVFVSQADLAALDLLGKGSRVKYEMLLKLRDQGRLEEVAGMLRDRALGAQERVNTFRQEGSRIKRFFDNLLFFLSLISIFTLLLAGLGMQSCLTALVRQKEKTIAIARSLGARSGFLYRHYLLLVLLLGLAGAALGVAAGAGLAAWLPNLFRGLLPVQGEVAIRLVDVGGGMLLGLLVVLLFTFLPLYRLRNIKPAAIFRRESGTAGRDAVYYAACLTGVVLATLLVIGQLEDLSVGLWFMAGLLLFIAVTAVLAHLALQAMTRLVGARLGLRQAVRSMTRTGNATRSIIVTLAAALAVLFAIHQVERNLHLNYIESYPQGAPNLFSLDIQPDQRRGFAALFPQEPELYPIIRARLTAINGEPIDRSEEMQKRRDNFAREFNLTYRDHLLEDEVVSRGGSLFPGKSGAADLEVSILDTVAEMGDLALGDILRFNIQGVELTAEVTSIRSRTRSKLYPFFYFVFPEESLREAPQTFFSATYVAKDKIAALQSKILERYPNISFINVAATAEEIEVLMGKLSAIVRFFASFSLLAGALILLSSILATRLERTRESVYYKILGARKAFVYKIFVWENGFIGLLSGAIAMLLAHLASWALCRYLFEIDYAADLPASLLLVLVTAGLVVATGLAATLAIVRQKPAKFLREHGNE